MVKTEGGGGRRVAVVLSRKNDEGARVEAKQKTTSSYKGFYRRDFGAQELLLAASAPILRRIRRGVTSAQARRGDGGATA